MTPALQLEILDLRHFSAASLRPLLEAESRLWSERLEWDYRASADLLLQYLDSRLLPGYVAIENGRVAGYLFCVYEERKAVIGDVFAIRPQNSEATATDIELRLLESLIELLQNSPGVERIESQLLLHPHGLHADAFRTVSFQIYNRLFMRLDLSGLSPAPARHSLPEGLAMRPWREDDFNAAAHLISGAYEGHLDSHSTARSPARSGSCTTSSAFLVADCSTQRHPACSCIPAATKSPQFCFARACVKMWPILRSSASRRTVAVTDLAPSLSTIAPRI